MTRTRMAEVRRIATRVRKWAEMVADETGDFDENLCGLCARASARLHIALSVAGIQSKLVEGDCHFFVVVNGYVVDVTATQFSRRTLPRPPKVLIRKWNLLRNKRPWSPSTIHSSPTKARRSQIRKTWPSKQVIDKRDYIV